MRKKILTGLLILGLFMAIASFSGGFAIFRDVEESIGNTFQAEEMQNSCGYLGKIEVADNGDLHIDAPTSGEKEVADNVFRLENTKTDKWCKLKFDSFEWKQENENELIKLQYHLMDGNIDGICKVGVKAGSEENMYFQNCATDNEIESRSYNVNDGRLGISYFKLWYCDWYWP
ncbi:hypothetical protein AKJ57_05455 [candidate division MSBL1 archaeon SCGC-AAA259A05]|uniref:Uncharacterized protein n=1 Tax=candidate division MSBL1 archaeon SCGC-AAA259A05 TaxID=1698259 RepID=A0A133U553_9EURY|nr:hypothetical protein AKJ57_05455 [candidate division MSBL1 archaeon SCGC-AAA259A05]